MCSAYSSICKDFTYTVDLVSGDGLEQWKTSTMWSSFGMLEPNVAFRESPTNLRGDTADALRNGGRCFFHWESELL